MLKTLSLWSRDDTGFQYSSHFRILGRNQSLVQREQLREPHCVLTSSTSGCAQETQSDKEPGSVGHQLLLPPALQGQNLGTERRGHKKPLCSRGSLLHPLRKKRKKRKRDPSPLSFSSTRFWIGSDCYLLLKRSKILSDIRIISSLTQGRRQEEEAQ